VGKNKRKYSKEQWERKEAYQKDYKEKNKEKIATYHKLRREENYLQYLLIESKSRAKQKGWSNTLDLKWLEDKFSHTVCSKTGIVFSEDMMWRPSIDRIDSEQGYTKTNCQLVCWAYNRAKSNMSDVDMLKLCKGVVETALLNRHRIFNEDLINE
jgi:hypothetical protein